MANIVSGLPIGKFIVRFIAYSTSGTNTLSINSVGTIALTKEPKFYEYEVDNNSGYFRFYVNKNPSDIYITDIEVYETLGKFTINGVDGFDKFDGRLAPNATIIDNQTVRLDAVSWGESSYLRVGVEPYTDYYVSADSDCEYGVFNYDASKVLVEYSLKGGTFNSGNNTVVRFYFKNAIKEKGTFFFRNPMITLGTFKVPYEKKKGSVMVKPSIVKNIIREPIESWRYNWLGNSTIDKFEDYVRITLDTSKQSSSAISHRYSLIEVSREKQYTLSFTARANRKGVQPNYIYVMSETAGNKVVNRDAVPYLSTEWGRYSIPISSDKTVSDANVMIGLYSGTSSNVNGDWVELKDIQLEEGSVATSYEPFKTQLNKVPNYVPSKNLLLQQDLTAWSNERSIVEDTGEFYKGNKVYKVSFKNESLPRIYSFFDPPVQNISASVYVKMLKKDGGSPNFYIRQEGFGTVYAVTGMDTPIGEWKRVELNNFSVKARSMFLLYYSPQTPADIEMLIAMPQVEISRVPSKYESPRIKKVRPALNSEELWIDNKDQLPLPTGWTYNPRSPLLDKDTYRVTFRAMSPTPGKIRVVDNDSTSINEFIELTTEYKEYEVIFESKRDYPGVLMFYSVLDKPDVYIKDISFKRYRDNKAKLVTKKNLFDFKSSTPVSVGGYINLTKTDEYIEASIKAGGYGFKFLNVPVKRNTDYVYSVKHDVIKGDTLGIRVHFLNTDTYSVAVRGSTEHIFNSGQNDSIDLMYYAGMAVDVDSIIRVYGIQLEEGKKRTEYEPYKLVNKQAKR
jgi:hypothetical protein